MRGHRIGDLFLEKEPDTFFYVFIHKVGSVSVYFLRLND